MVKFSRNWVEKYSKWEVGSIFIVKNTIEAVNINGELDNVFLEKDDVFGQTI